MTMMIIMIRIMIVAAVLTLHAPGHRHPENFACQAVALITGASAAAALASTVIVSLSLNVILCWSFTLALILGQICKFDLSLALYLD